MEDIIKQKGNFSEYQNMMRDEEEIKCDKLL